jgi:hypothetical protein
VPTSVPMGLHSRHLLTAFVVAACAGAVAAPAAMAGWTRTQAIEPGVNPVLSFGPAGDAAIGSTVFSPCGDAVGTYIAVRPARGEFGPPASLGRRQGNCGDWPGLLAIALPADGATAALFGPLGADEQPIDAFVRARGAGGFGAAQQLVPLGNAGGDAGLPNATAVVDTASGEVVEVGEDDDGNVSTATLAPGSNRFTISGRAPAGLTDSDIVELATDGAGGTFMAGDGNNGCTVAAYRPAHGAFATRYRSTVCGDRLRSVVQGIAAAGNGYAALLSENTDETGTGTSSLLIQVGRFGRFRAPVVLSSVLGTPFGVAAGRNGAATVAWTGCTPGAVVNDLLTLHSCNVYAETGTVTGGFTGQPAVIAPSAPGVGLDAIVADRAVAVQRCARHRRCTIAVAVARRGGGFGPLQRLTTNGRRLVALQADGRGDLLVAWSNYRGVLYAAIKAVSARRLGPPHRLSGMGVNPATATAAFGPDGEAVVAWSQSGETSAAVYSLRR